MTYYCRLDSANRIEATNLQLYSLEKAAKEWNDLIELVNEIGIENVDCLSERMTFIINCFGLSISQLIGQNCPPSNSNRIESPSKLLPKMLKGIADNVTQERLESDFKDFLVYYDAIRHFGKVKYKSIDELTLTKLDHFRCMTIEIWDLVISKYRQNKENNIEEFSSISEIVYFENISINPIA